MDQLEKIIREIELHNVEGIRECFTRGLSPNAVYRNEPLIYELTSEYTRSPRFRDCIKAFKDAGLETDDPLLLAVLLDDAATLDVLLAKDPTGLRKEYTLRCAYTPMFKISLLHICAEFDHVAAARVLLKHGADVNCIAGTDENGFGGQTPVFHTVNQNNDQSSNMLRFLLEQNADLRITVPGIVWGKGYDWETFIPAVNPVSYAMMGLLPQMHRDERTVALTVSLLMKHAFGIHYMPLNIPCAYLLR